MAPGTAAMELQKLLTSFWILPATHAIATLGVPEVLAGGPRSAAEIARACGANEDALARMMRALAMVGVFAEQPDGRFALTPMSELLRADAPDSVRPFLMMTGGRLGYGAWVHVLHTLKTGQPATEHLFGRPPFEHLEASPEDAEVFDAAMISSTAIDKRGILASYDFGRFSRIVDVGGGAGGMLVPILEQHPGARGVLFDRRQVAQAARATIDKTGVADRVEIVGGDFFEEVPRGGDAYLLKSVLHDWDDARAARILASVRRAMDAGTHLLVVERVLPPAGQPHFGRVIDLMMLVIVGGRERTLGEYRALLDAAGFEVARVVPTQAPQSVIEAVAR